MQAGDPIPPPHNIARRLINNNYVGMMFNAFAVGCTSDDVNLVQWKWNHSPSHQISVHDPSSELPADQAPWP